MDKNKTFKGWCICTYTGNTLRLGPTCYPREIRAGMIVRAKFMDDYATIYSVWADNKECPITPYEWTVPKDRLTVMVDPVEKFKSYGPASDDREGNHTGKTETHEGTDVPEDIAKEINDKLKRIQNDIDTANEIARQGDEYVKFLSSVVKEHEQKGSYYKSSVYKLLCNTSLDCSFEYLRDRAKEVCDIVYANQGKLTESSEKLYIKALKELIDDIVMVRLRIKEKRGYDIE